MTTKQLIALITVLLVGGGITFWAWKNMSPAQNVSSAHGHGHGHGSAHEDEDARGIHGGRLVAEGDFELEISIFEKGIPPQFRIYGFKNHKPLDPASITLNLELKRLGGRVDRFSFKPEGDYLLGDLVVEEPHSFMVSITAGHEGSEYSWQYESYEGRTELSPTMLQESGIAIEKVAPREIGTWLSTYGRIAPNEDQLAYVLPRFPGTVQEIDKRLGDTVTKGERLAIIQSTETLQTYEVKSPLAGTIIQKNVSAGELTRADQILYVVGNLDTVWVDLHIYPKDFARVKTGQKTFVTLGENLPVFEGDISYISPFGSENNQTILARLVLPNPEGHLRPGLFVSARIEVEKTMVATAVKVSALQTFRDWQVVFLKDGNVFEIGPLELGRRDDQWVEVLSGLKAGQEYAAENSFTIKADIMKSGATHDH